MTFIDIVTCPNVLTTPKWVGGGWGLHMVQPQERKKSVKGIGGKEDYVKPHSSRIQTTCCSEESTAGNSV